MVDPLHRIIPAFSWADVERTLLDLQQASKARLVIPHLVSASAKTTIWLGAEGVLRELCLTSWAALDGLSGEESPMS